MLESFLERLRGDRALAACICAYKVEPPREGSFVDYPAGVPLALREHLENQGIRQLYGHQGLAFESIQGGRHTVLVTSTASGKSLAYNLPILSELGTAASRERPTALYLFPTKALSQDQVVGLERLLAAFPERVGEGALGVQSYDGDTPASQRRLIRRQADLLVTNPYMLHTGILPNHMGWARFFRRLRYVVIDELHRYQGVLGSSVANVIRRLKRVAAHYGSRPVFVATSATIRNPRAHFEHLCEETPLLIDKDGAPRAERHHVFFNPPLVNPALGLRARAVDQVRLLAGLLMTCSVPTIVFGRSRTTVELLTKYLKDLAPRCGLGAEQVVGYRGGYLPRLRRRIECGLREGHIRVVAATNALELGVDIGSLDAVLMTGYPGSVASYHQQSGRAGRRSGRSLSLLVGQSLPLDQYVMQESRFVLEGQGEQVVVDPDNLVLAANHLKCAAFELPFDQGEPFGRFPHGPELLKLLSGPGEVLLLRGGRYHWMAESFPAQDVGLDAVEADSFLVLEGQEHKSLGHVDRAAALTTLYPGAIYQHQGRQYQVRELDFEGRRAHADPVQVDYYTMAETSTAIQVLHQDQARERATFATGAGEVHVSLVATLFKKIRFYTNENLETGPIKLPAEEMETTAWWLVLGPKLEQRVRLEALGRAGAVGGLAHLFRGVAPLIVRMGGREMRARGFGSHPHFKRPLIMLYDHVPGGVGLSEGLFEHEQELFQKAWQTLSRCACKRGCPSCIGIAGDRGAPAKEAALEILRALLGEEGQRGAQKPLLDTRNTLLGAS